jgi:hypothetical protein
MRPGSPGLFHWGYVKHGERETEQLQHADLSEASEREPERAQSKHEMSDAFAGRIARTVPS